MTDLRKIRNFSIIAHIDHGKSTLADRLIQHCGGLTDREMSEQVLDNMDIEKERGITIKAQTVRLDYTARDGETYELNLMDTPGHVDFAYEVSRSLAACEGALLVVDAAQGVEAQTLANVYQSIEHDHEIVPVINKIDLPAAEPQRVAEEIEEIVGIEATGPSEEGGAVLTSAKSGIGIEETLEALVKRIPPPTGDRDAPLKAMLVDSWYDPYLGVVILVRVMDGAIKKGLNVRFMQGGTQHLIDRVGCFTPKRTDLPELGPGEIGFITAQIKEVEQARVGDTITTVKGGADKALPGYKEVQPVVFCGLFPVDAADFEKLRESIGKLRLNDASFSFEAESSAALGFGFRVGFLGTLHMEIIQERLEREYDLDLLTTAPTVVYELAMKNGDIQYVSNPSKLPDMADVEQMREPIVRASILVPQEFVGNVIAECEQRRGTQLDMQFLGNQIQLTYELPMSEVVMDFFDRLKSISRGYASLEYNFERFEAAKLVRLDVLINGDKVDALAVIIHRDHAHSRGRLLVEKMKELIPRQMFDVAIQAAIGGQVVARSTVKALRKNVTAKCYGGDVSRKKKLLEKQKAGKKRMKQVGRVEIPQDAFLAVLKVND